MLDPALLQGGKTAGVERHKVPLVRWEPAPRMNAGRWKLAGQEQAQESQAGWQKIRKSTHHFLTDGTKFHELA